MASKNLRNFYEEFTVIYFILLLLITLRNYHILDKARFSLIKKIEFYYSSSWRLTYNTGEPKIILLLLRCENQGRLIVDDEFYIIDHEYT